MKDLSTALLLMFCIPAALSSAQHTTCYNYFLQKDGCVISSADPQDRCQSPPPPKNCTEPVGQFSFPSSDQNGPSSSRLQRRYDTTQESFYVAGGTGVCGTYDTTKVYGVCLWNGAEQQYPTLFTAGWVNGPQPVNCGKKVYVQRKGRPETVQYVRVIDGCFFNATSTYPGCFQVGLTQALFNSFNPTEEEQSEQLLSGGITWDFLDPIY